MLGGHPRRLLSDTPSCWGCGSGWVGYPAGGSVRRRARLRGAPELSVVCGGRSFPGLDSPLAQQLSTGAVPPGVLGRASVVYMPGNACFLLHAWAVNSRAQVRRASQMRQVWKSRCAGRMMAGSGMGALGIRQWRRECSCSVSGPWWGWGWRWGQHGACRELA